jgi:Nucleoside 2-deoxyribosyltransferase like
MKVYLAPEIYTVTDRTSIFLAGSIEMGKAEDWQTLITQELEEFDIDILNPRRRDWDSSWEQKITNPQFYQQVNWELNSLDHANIIVMYLQPGTISPISLLELGLYKHKNILVCCPEGFHRKGNVDIVCERFAIPVYETLDDMIFELKRFLRGKL